MYATRSSSFLAGLWSGLSSISVTLELESIPLELFLLLYSLIAFLLPFYFFVMGMNNANWSELIRNPARASSEIRDLLPRVAIYFIMMIIGMGLVFFSSITIS